MKLLQSILIIAALSAPWPVSAANADSPDSQQPLSTKRERNLIRKGNDDYRQKRFAESEVSYRKALELVPGSETARFNLAAALIRQSGSADPNNGNKPMQEATSLLQELGKTATDPLIASRAYYNLGNMAFNSQNYAQSIELYKNALRKNPSDNKARENLRLAQLKQQQQQRQDQQQDQQQNQDQQNQDQQQQQQQQDQQQNQNQQNQDQQQQQQNQDQQKQQQQQQGMSDANAEKILKAMENEEAATRKKVDAEKKKAAAARRRHITNPW